MPTYVPYNPNAAPTSIVTPAELGMSLKASAILGRNTWCPEHFAGRRDLYEQYRQGLERYVQAVPSVAAVHAAHSAYKQAMAPVKRTALPARMVPVNPQAVPQSALPATHTALPTLQEVLQVTQAAPPQLTTQHTYVDATTTQITYTDATTRTQQPYATSTPHTEYVARRERAHEMMLRKHEEEEEERPLAAMVAAPPLAQSRWKPGQPRLHKLEDPASPNALHTVPPGAHLLAEQLTLYEDEEDREDGNYSVFCMLASTSVLTNPTRAPPITRRVQLMRWTGHEWLPFPGTRPVSARWKYEEGRWEAALNIAPDEKRLYLARRYVFCFV